mgnify:CR=1 FL=1
MVWTRRFWIFNLILFIFAFFTGTHLPGTHLYFALPSIVLMMGALTLLLISPQASLRVRGTALTLLLIFFMASLLGWSSVADTMPVSLHSIFMGIFAFGAVVLTYEIFWTPSGQGVS